MSVLKFTAYGLVAFAVLASGALIWSARTTRGEIEDLEAAVIAQAAAAPPFNSVASGNLPAPVARYFAYVFPNGPPKGVTHAEIEMAGQFRRPLTDGFQPTTARQVASARMPDMVFSADTPIVGPIWAIAWDAYIGGRMEMNARLLSAVTIVHQDGTPELDRISLRRWLLESPTYPMALLPGGPVTWTAIDDRRARATVRAHGKEISLVATFGPDGALTAFDAEEEGDLTTPYHGSGEHTSRGDYRMVDGVRIPMSFEIARVGEGAVHPFWTGRITSIRFAAK